MAMGSAFVLGVFDSAERPPNLLIKTNLKLQQGAVQQAVAETYPRIDSQFHLMETGKIL